VSKPFTDQEFDEELLTLLEEMQASQQLLPLIMVLEDLWQPFSDELHNEVVARLERQRQQAHV
jgi:hypothetical protein